MKQPKKKQHQHKKQPEEEQQQGPQPAAFRLVASDELGLLKGARRYVEVYDDVSEALPAAIGANISSRRRRRCCGRRRGARSVPPAAAAAAAATPLPTNTPL